MVYAMAGTVFVMASSRSEAFQKREGPDLHDLSYRRRLWKRLKPVFIRILYDSYVDLRSNAGIAVIERSPSAAL